MAADNAASDERFTRRVLVSPVTHPMRDLYRVEIVGRAGFMEREVMRTVYLNKADLMAAQAEIEAVLRAS